jgi:hypothetical protein
MYNYLTMDDVDFSVSFLIYPNKKKVIPKSDMVRVNKHNYRAVLNTDSMGKGRIMYQIDITTPDGTADIISGATNETLSSGV